MRIRGAVSLDRASAKVTMRFFHRLALNLGVVGELFAFCGRNKRWWLLPMLITLSLFGMLIILAQSSVIGPFVYSLF